MLHLCLKTLNLLAEPSHIKLVLTSVDSLLEFRKATRDRLAHLESLPTSIAEDKHPPVLAELAAQSLRIVFKLSPLLL
jgi:hypothetical protein